MHEDGELTVRDQHHCRLFLRVHLVRFSDWQLGTGAPVQPSPKISIAHRPPLSQLAIALARLFHGPPGQRDTSFHIADQQALTSLLTFLGGAFLGRIGDRMGAKTRVWLFLGTFIQALFTMAAALCVWQSDQGDYANGRGDPSWTNALTFACIGFMSASIGLQGIMGKRVNTQFATTSAYSSLLPLFAFPPLRHRC